MEVTSLNGKSLRSIGYNSLGTFLTCGKKINDLKEREDYGELKYNKLNYSGDLIEVFKKEE